MIITTSRYPETR